MNTHETTIHGRCPIKNVWDYYTLRVTTHGFIFVEEIEAKADLVRGISACQEFIANELHLMLPDHCTIELIGRHGQNCETVCRCEARTAPRNRTWPSQCDSNTQHSESEAR